MSNRILKAFRHMPGGASAHIELSGSRQDPAGVIQAVAILNLERRAAPHPAKQSHMRRGAPNDAGKHVVFFEILRGHRAFEVKRFVNLKFSKASKNLKDIFEADQSFLFS